MKQNIHLTAFTCLVAKSACYYRSAASEHQEAIDVTQNKPERKLIETLAFELSNVIVSFQFHLELPAKRTLHASQR